MLITELLLIGVSVGSQLSRHQITKEVFMRSTYHMVCLTLEQWEHKCVHVVCVIKVRCNVSYIVVKKV